MYVYICIKLYFSFVHSCVRGTDNIKHENEIDLFEEIDENVSFSMRKSWHYYKFV